MGLLSQARSKSSRDTLLPTDIVAKLERLGRFEFDPQGSGVDPVGLPDAEYALLQRAKQDPDGFIAALAAVTVSKGDWAAYGAMRLMWHFGLADSDMAHPDADAIRLCALQFIRDSGYGWHRLTPREQAFWQRKVGEW